MKIRAPNIAIIVLIGMLSVSLLASLVVAAWSYWQIASIGGWRDEVYGLEGMVASGRALDDFRDGHLRLYRLGGENEKAKYTGTNDGPFEVWIPQFYPSLGRAHRYSKEQFIEFYNRKMHYMQAHPERFRVDAKEVQPDGAANGSQPFSSETNSTSSAAGSRR